MNFGSRTFSNTLADFFQKELSKLEVISKISPLEKSNTNEDTQQNSKYDQNFRDLIQFLRELKISIESERNFSSLIDKVDDEIEKSKRTLRLVEELNSLKEIKKQSENQLREKENVQKESENEIINQEIIQELSRHQKVYEMTKKINFVKLKNQNILSQQELQIQINEKKANDQLLMTAIDETYSKDAYFKIIKFYRVKMKELKEEILEMENNYNEFIESVETKLQEGVSEQRRLLKTINRERELFEERKTQLENYELEKRQFFEERTKAVVIQAWWRGTMVRRNLGPFKKLRKGKKKKKSKKKKKAGNKNK